MDAEHEGPRRTPTSRTTSTTISPGAAAGLQLAQRLRDDHKGTDLGDHMRELGHAIEEDRDLLESLMDQIGAPNNPVKRAGAVAGELLTRAKFGLSTAGHRLGRARPVRTHRDAEHGHRGQMLALANARGTRSARSAGSTRPRSGAGDARQATTRRARALSGPGGFARVPALRSVPDVADPLFERAVLLKQLEGPLVSLLDPGHQLFTHQLAHLGIAHRLVLPVVLVASTRGTRWAPVLEHQLVEPVADDVIVGRDVVVDPEVPEGGAAQVGAGPSISGSAISSPAMYLPVPLALRAVRK